MCQGVFGFQATSSGAAFFINTDLAIHYPNSEDFRLEVLDSLDPFTRSNIRQALVGKEWFDAYRNLKGTLLD